MVSGARISPQIPKLKKDIIIQAKKIPRKLETINAEVYGNSFNDDINAADKRCLSIKIK